MLINEKNCCPALENLHLYIRTDDGKDHWVHASEKLCSMCLNCKVRKVRGKHLTVICDFSIKTYDIEALPIYELMLKVMKGEADPESVMDKREELRARTFLSKDKKEGTTNAPNNCGNRSKP